MKINPLQVRRFAEAVGTRAKTDAVDARLIAAMAAQLDLPTTAPLPEPTRLLKALQIARQGLVKDRAAAKNRAHSHEDTFLKRQAAARLQHVTAQLAALDAEIATLIAGDECLARRRDILISIPGVSAVTAATLLAEAPELGTLEGKAAARAPRRIANLARTAACSSVSRGWWPGFGASVGEAFGFEGGRFPVRASFAPMAPPASVTPRLPS